MENSLFDLLLSTGGVWAGVSVYLFLTFKSAVERQQKDSMRREERLMAHLEKTNESHEKIAQSMENLEGQMKEGFSKVWAEINIIRR